MHDDQELPPLESADELEASGAAVRGSGDRTVSVRSRISDAMVGMKKDFYGKGPTKAKTFINDEYVFVVLEGGLTRSETTLLQAGEQDLVRTFRLRFQEVMAATAIGAIEEILGRKVLTYHSQILFDPERAIEVFVLESSGG